MIIHTKAYAKVNIGLSVLERREDGYHNLDTYFHLTELADDLTLEVEEGSVTTVTIEGNEDYLAPGQTDLMEKAAHLFSSLCDMTFSLKVSIEKHIPHQAGLGGGSSDAASVLLALNEAFGNSLSRDVLVTSSLALGSDVPFFVSGLCCAHGSSRGEILKEETAVDYPILIVFRPGDKVSTGKAFSLLDERTVASSPLPGWNADLSSWRGLYHNDFDFIQPILKDIAFSSIASRAPYSSTSGSGSSQILVFGSEEERVRLAKELAGFDMIISRFKKFHFE